MIIIKPHSYSIFPVFNQNNTTDYQVCYKITGLSNVLKQITFTEEQFNIIKTKYHPVIKEKLNSVTTTPTCTIVSDINSDINSDNNSDINWNNITDINSDDSSIDSTSFL